MGICSSSTIQIPPIPEAPVTLEQLADLPLAPLGAEASKGCLMCRAEAQQLAALHAELREAGSKIRLVGIVYEPYSLKGFVSYFKGGDLFMDVDKNFYKAMGDRWLSIINGLRLPEVQQNARAARAKGILGNVKGEGRLLGGTLIIGPGDLGVVYTHHERVWGDLAPTEELREACARISGDAPPATASGAGQGSSESSKAPVAG